MEKLKKLNKLYFSLFILTILFLIVGSTYAYYQIYVKGEDTGIKGSSAEFFEGMQGIQQEEMLFTPNSDVQMKLETTGYIKASNLLLIKPIDIEDKSQKGYFRVTNKDYNNKINYSISLVELSVSPNLQVTDFKWQLVMHNTKEVISSGDFASANANTLLLKNDIIIDTRTAHEIELRLWIEENDKDQRYLLNGSFIGKIKIEGFVNNQNS